MAPPSCANEAIFDIGEGQNSNSMRLISLYHEIGTDLNIKGGTEVPSNQLAADLARKPSTVGTQVNNLGNDGDIRVFQRPPTRPQLMPQLSLNSGNLKPQLEVSDFRIRKLRLKLRLKLRYF